MVLIIESVKMTVNSFDVLPYVMQAISVNCVWWLSDLSHCPLLLAALTEEQEASSDTYMQTH